MLSNSQEVIFDVKKTVDGYKIKEIKNNFTYTYSMPKMYSHPSPNGYKIV